MASEEHHNILLIYTDQHMCSAIGAYGSEICRTPNLDALAEESVIFENAYTTCPVCSPARASLQTGLYPFKHGMQTNLFMPGCMVHELPDRPYLLSRKLRDAGYEAGYTGKWHLGYGREAFGDDYYNAHINEIDLFRDYIDYPDAYRQASGMPTDVGYEGDDFPGHGGGGNCYPQFLRYLEEIGQERVIERHGEHHGAVVTSAEDTTVDYFLVERSREIIAALAKDSTPWCHTLAFWGPHEPYTPPARYYDMYRDLPIPPWPSFAEEQADKPRIHWAKRPGHEWAHFERELRLYYAYITFIDAQIGRLITWLRDEGMWDSTTVVFSADHGDSMGIHGGLEDKSCHLYEETVRVPLIIRPAGGVEPRRETRLNNTTDLHATLVDLAGGAVAARCHGRSLLPLVRGEAIKDWPDHVVVESSGLGLALHSSRMIRVGPHKYVFNCGGIDELYDLEADPHEMNNLVRDDASRPLLRDLQHRLGTWLEEHGDPLARQYPLIVRAGGQ